MNIYYIDHIFTDAKTFECKVSAPCNMCLFNGLGRKIIDSPCFKYGNNVKKDFSEPTNYIFLN
jgi:hypothetical protein